MLVRLGTMWGSSSATGEAGSVAVSGAATLASGETQALALDFTDSFWQASTGFYGSAYVKDTTTPANDYNSSPTQTASSLLTYTSPSLKFTTGPSGTIRAQAHNFITRSNDFKNAAYVSTNILAYGAGSVQDAVLAPTGEMASLLVPSTGSNAKIISQTGIATAGDISHSIVAKAGGYSKIALKESSTSGNYATFNLSTGAVITSTATSSSITDLGNGWYRCSMTIAHVGTQGFQCNILAAGYVSGDPNASTFAGDGASGVYLASAHVRRTPSDSTYLATTTAARYALPLEWSSAGVLQGLLVEEARTNLVTYSDDLTNAAWTKTSLTTAKTATGPDGVANSATTLTATAAQGSARVAITSASAARITSLYVKRRTGSGTVGLSQSETTGSNLVTNGTFDADTNWTKPAGVTIAAGVASFSAVANNAALQQSAGLVQGKVYAYSLTVSNYSAGNPRLGLGGGGTVSIAAANGTYTGTFVCTGSGGTVEVYATGASSTFDIDNVTVTEVVETALTVTSSWTRVNTASATVTNPTIVIRLATSGDEIDVALVDHEVGSFITSPKPTIGATATRAVDNISLATSAFPFSATAGTMFGEVTTANVTSGPRVGSLNDGTANERITVYFNSGAALDLFVGDGGVGQTSSATANTTPLNTIAKAGAAWQANDFAWVLNGGVVKTDSSGTLPTVTTLNIGHERTVTQLNGYLRKFMYLPRRMTDGDLDTLTT